MTFRISSFVLPWRAMTIATAVASAPFMPSGWSCEMQVTAAERSYASSTSFAANPTGLIRIADPLPKLLYGSGFSENIQ